MLDSDWSERADEVSITFGHGLNYLLGCEYTGTERNASECEYTCRSGEAATAGVKLQGRFTGETHVEGVRY